MPSATGNHELKYCSDCNQFPGAEFLLYFHVLAQFSWARLIVRYSPCVRSATVS